MLNGFRLSLQASFWKANEYDTPSGCIKCAVTSGTPAFFFSFFSREAENGKNRAHLLMHSAEMIASRAHGCCDGEMLRSRERERSPLSVNRPTLFDKECSHDTPNLSRPRDKNAIARQGGKLVCCLLCLADDDECFVFG